MQHKEDLIKEQRLSEAMINGYIGQQGKFAYILRWLGFPIIEQNDTMPSDDILDYEKSLYSEDEKIPEMSEETSVFEVGYYFDGLKYGYNIDIKLDSLSKEIKVIFNGKTVYKEESGELLAYVPDKKWEEAIKSLCEVAKKVETRRKTYINQELKRQIKEKKHDIYKDLNEKWGI